MPLVESEYLGRVSTVYPKQGCNDVLCMCSSQRAGTLYMDLQLLPTGTPCDKPIPAIIMSLSPSPKQKYSVILGSHYLSGIYSVRSMWILDLECVAVGPGWR